MEPPSKTATNVIRYEAAESDVGMCAYCRADHLGFLGEYAAQELSQVS